MYFKILFCSIAGADRLSGVQELFEPCHKTKNRTASSSGSTVTAIRKSTVMQHFFDSASQRYVTVRQIFSDDPAWKIQAFSALRRLPLSPSAAAWPCRRLLLKPAPLSERFNFPYTSTIKRICQPFFAFLSFCTRFLSTIQTHWSPCAKRAV